MKPKGSLHCSQQPTTWPKPTYTVHALLLDFFKIHFNIIILSMPRCSVVSLSLPGFPTKTSFSLCHMPYPSYPPYSKHHKSWRFLLHNFHQPSVTSSPLGPTVHVSTLFSNNNMQISNFTLCKLLIKGY